jgi:RNA polymerase sigma-70 factor (ECF subfamily)
MRKSARPLEAFLKEVDRRAFRMARLASGSDAEALDLVQDALCRFVERYAERPEDEWRPLFWRVLVNRTRDFGRRRTFRSRFLGWLPGAAEAGDGGEDPLESVADPGAASPEAALAGAENLEAVHRALQGLPARQREAFLLRAWEELSVSEAAEVMNCTEGSVKTHYFRAVQALQARLSEYRP